MKRVFISAFLLLVCICMLLGCGKKSGGEYIFGAVDKSVSVLEENRFYKFITKGSDSFHVGVSVNDLSAFSKAVFLKLPDIEDASVDLYADFGSERALGNATAKIDGEKVDAAVYADLDNVVVKSSLLDKAYGIEAEKVFGGSFDKNTFSEIAEALNAFGKMGNVAQKYLGEFEKAFDKYVDSKVKVSGEEATVTFTITKKEFVKICFYLSEAVESDEDLEVILSALGISSKELADGLSEAYNVDDFTAKFTVVMHKDDYTVYSVDVNVESESEVSDLKYRFDEEKLSFSLEYTDNFSSEITDSEYDGKIILIGRVGNKNEYICNLKVFLNDSIEFEGEVVVTASEITLKYGTVEITFLYLLDDNAIRLGLLDMKTEGLKFDLSKVGFCITFEKNVGVPTAPKAEMLSDADEFFEILKNISGDALAMLD